MKLYQHPSRHDLFLTKDGRVFRELTPSKSHGGYHLIRNGNLKVRRHTLVLETFRGPRPSPKHGARHLNGNPGDDRAINLKWGTQKENCEDTVRHGRSVRGSKQGASKLTDQEAIEIRKRLAAGEAGSQLAKEYGLTHASICDLRYGRTWAWLPGIAKRKDK